MNAMPDSPKVYSWDGMRPVIDRLLAEPDTEDAQPTPPAWVGKYRLHLDEYGDIVTPTTIEASVADMWHGLNILAFFPDIPHHPDGTPTDEAIATLRRTFPKARIFQGVSNAG